MSQLQAPYEVKDLPLGDAFWTSEQEKLYDILFPILKSSALDAAKASYDELGGIVSLGVAWDVIHDKVIQWAKQHTVEVVSQITDTSMAAFIENFEKWVRSGAALQDLIDVLEPYYGAVRAEMVAVTEVTRAFALGNMAMWLESGVVTGFNWRTAMDDLVCPVCEPLGAQGPYDLHHDLPPAHVRCRCWITPVVPL